MKIKLLATLITAISASATTLFAQPLPDSAQYIAVPAVYQTALASQYEIFKGDEYVEPYAYQGSTYFMNNNLMAIGVVSYNDHVYTNVLLNYDVYIDALIGYNQILNTRFVLAPTKVYRFKLREHNFINITPALNKTIKSGYYEELYGGTTTFLAKRIKIRRSQLAIEGVQPIYDDKTELFLLKNNIYHKVKSQRDVVKLLKDQQDKINSFIKQKGLKFNEDREQSIALIAAYYDQISAAQ